MSTWTGRATIVTEVVESHRRRPTRDEAEARAVEGRKLWTSVLGLHWTIFVLVMLAGFDVGIAAALLLSGYAHAMAYIFTFGWFEGLVSRLLPVTAERRLRVYSVVPGQLSLRDDATLEVAWAWDEAIDVERTPTEESAETPAAPLDLTVDLDQAVVHVARNADQIVLIEVQGPRQPQRLVIALDRRDEVPEHTLQDLPTIHREALHLDAPAAFFKALSPIAEALNHLPGVSRQSLKALC